MRLVLALLLVACAGCSHITRPEMSPEDTALAKYIMEVNMTNADPSSWPQ